MPLPTIEEQIKELEEEISTTEYNKKTQHHIGKLKAKIARLKAEAEKRKSVGKATGGGYAIPKEGDATVTIVGPPNVGKSTLINVMTAAKSDVGEYGFTTLSIIPGIMEYKGARIQMMDLPGLVEGAAKGRGKGKDVLSVVRSSDMILLMCDVKDHDLSVIMKELQEFGLRLNQRPPDIVIKPKDRGGIIVTSTCKLTKVDLPTIKAMLGSFGHVNANITIRANIDDAQLVDFLAGNRSYVRSMVVLNKVDLVDDRELKHVRAQMPKGMKCIDVSLKERRGIEELRTAIYRGLEFIRIYLRPKGGKPDMSTPLILVKGSTVGHTCAKLHKDFTKKFRYASIWGKSAKFDGQTVGLNHVLMDKDILTIIISR